MKSQWHKFRYMFLLIIAVVTAGIVSTGLLASAKTDSKDDVQSTAVPGQIAPRLQSLGNHKFPVTTSSARAQLFMNQGMMLTYGFNHAEATRSFREAARLDPNCAMAYWGMALVLGPNINMAMAPEAEPQAYEWIKKAISLKKFASEKEKAYIDALAVRYSGNEKPDRNALDHNYAKATLKIANVVLAGELAAKRGYHDLAIARLHRAILLEDNLIYNEPPDWHVPVRQALGAVLLDAGRPAEAESIYWQDLSLNRENGWSLFGLMQSLRAQGKTEQVVVIEERFRKAWNRADVMLTASRFMGVNEINLAAKTGN